MQDLDLPHPSMAGMHLDRGVVVSDTFFFSARSPIVERPQVILKTLKKSRCFDILELLARLLGFAHDQLIEQITSEFSQRISEGITFELIDLSSGFELLLSGEQIGPVVFGW
jgi:hypothetical protein